MFVTFPSLPLLMFLSLIFVHLITVCLVPPWVYFAWYSACFPNLCHCFLFHVRGVFSYSLFKYYLRAFRFSLSFLLLLFNCSILPDSLWSHGLRYARLPCLSPSPRVFSNSCPLSRWYLPTILSSVAPFSYLQSFSASGSFLMSWLFASGGQTLELQFQSSPFGTSVLWILVCFMLYQRSLRLSSFTLLFFLSSVPWKWFPVFCHPGHLSILPFLEINILLLISSNVFSISVVFLYHLSFFSFLRL